VDNQNRFLADGTFRFSFFGFYQVDMFILGNKAKTKK